MVWRGIWVWRWRWRRIWRWLITSEEWTPTPEFRFVERGKSKPLDMRFKVLQQKWVKPSMDKFGIYDGWDLEEWRDVPLVEEE